MARYDVSEAEWRLIAPLLPNKPRGVARVDDRRIINAIFYVLRTGSPWRDLPSRYGPYATAYNRYNRWSKAGIWLRIFETLAAKSPQSLHRSTPRSFALTSTPPAEERGPGSRHRPFSWRTEHQDQRRRGRERPALSGRALSRPSLRQNRRRGPVGRTTSHPCPYCRSRLRRPSHCRTGPPARRPSAHPDPARSQSSALGRSEALSPTQPDRALLL